jgi:hypothetical protein
MSRTEESRRIVKRVQEEENQPGPSRIQQETRTQNRARCKFCPSNNDNKTNRNFLNIDAEHKTQESQNVEARRR